MMVADTSALIAVAAKEPGYLEIYRTMETGGPVLISAATRARTLPERTSQRWREMTGGRLRWKRRSRPLKAVCWIWF